MQLQLYSQDVRNSRLLGKQIEIYGSYLAAGVSEGCRLNCATRPVTAQWRGLHYGAEVFF